MAKTSRGGSQSGDQPIKEELKQDAETLKQSAQDRAKHEARKGRDQAVDTARATSSAIDSAAEELRCSEDAPDWLASMLSSASGQIEQVAGELDGKEPREMMRAVERFGRDKPATFLAASAALGFAAGRYLRAGAEQHGDIDAVRPDGSIAGSSSKDTSLGTARTGGTASRSMPRYAEPTAATATPDPAATTLVAGRGGSDRGGQI